MDSLLGLIIVFAFGHPLWCLLRENAPALWQRLRRS